MFLLKHNILDEEKLKLLYDAVSKDYSLGTYDEFSQKLNDPTKRKAFYDGVGKEYELGSYEDFEGKIAKPVQTAPSTAEDPLYETGQLEEVGIVGRANPLMQGQGNFNFAENSNPKLVKAYDNAQALQLQSLSNQLQQQQAVYDTAQGTGATQKIQKSKKASNGAITKNIEDSERTGNRASYLYNELLNGLGSMAAGLGDVAVQMGTGLATNGAMIDSPNLTEYRQETAPSIRNFLTQNVGAELDGKLKAKYQNETFTAAIGGLANSAPAIAASAVSGGIGGTAMFLQSYDNALQSIENTEEGQNLDNLTKTIFATTVGTAVSALEKYGLDKIFKGESFVIGNLVAKQALKQATRETGGKVTGDVLSKFLDREIVNLSNKYIQGGVKALDGALVEYGTEALQEGVQAGGELLLNAETGKTVFDTTQTGNWQGFVGRMNKAGVLGAIGGGFLGSISAVAGLKRGDVESNEAKLVEVNEALANENLSEPSRQVLTQSKIAVQDDIEQDATKIDQAFDNLLDEQKEKVLDITDRKVKIANSLADEAVPESIKKDLKEEDKALDEQLTAVVQNDSLAVPVKQASEVNVGDTIVLEGGKRGVVSSVDGGLVKIDLERGGTLTANPTLVEMSIEQKTEPVAQEDGVIDVSQPQEELIPQEGEVAEPEIIVPETVTTPTQDKLTEIQTRRAEIAQRLKIKLTNLNSGINPDALKDLVDLGATYIEEGVVRFKDFAERLKADLGKELKDEDLRDIYKQSAEALGYGVRGFGERVRTEETTPEATQKALDETEQLYTRQDYGEIGERLAQMDDAEKQRLVGSLENVTAQLSSEQNIGVLAGIELINKYNAEGRTEEATKLIESLSESATVAAQTLRQYGEFKTSTPDGYMQLIEKWMAKANKKLTEAQKEKIRELFLIQQQQSQRVTDALESVTENLDDDSFKEYYAAVIGYEDAIRNLEDYIDTARGKTLFDTLAKILQGNLLSLKSVVINPFANLVQFGVRTAENDAATAVDQVVKLITGRRTKSATLTAANLKLSGNAVKQGISRANRKALKGTANSELSKYDVGGRLKPAVAWKRLFDNLKSSDTRVENQYGWEQGLSDFAEGTIGVPANIMFRLLPYGDDPFYEQARVQRLVEIGKNDKGLEGEALERFILKPDKDSSESAETYGREATFQEDNVISRNINRLINDGAKRVEALSGRQGAAAYRFVMKGILPFVNTPSSIAIKTVKFAVPAIPFAQAVNSAVQLRKAYKMNDSALKEKLLIRHQRDFANHMGEAIVSATVLGVATILVANGLATGDLPDDEYQKKQKNFMFATQPPNTLNISGVKRMLAGGSTAYEQGDITISYVPLGLIGAQIGIVSSTQGSALRDAKRKANVQTTEGKAYYPEADFNPLNFLGNFVTNAPAAMRYFFNQSFVQGAETVLSAVSKESGAKNIVPQLGKTFVTMGIPNTVSQAFRASNDYMRDLYTDDQLTTFANIIKEKVGAVEDLPIKYDLWGKPIKQTPDGSNPYVYQVLDIFRTQKILQDPITYAIFDIQRRSGDDGAVPSAVDDTFTKRDIKVKLNKEQKSELTKLVGEERRKNAERVLKSYVAGKSDTEKYIVRLKKAYEGGARRGLMKFKKDSGIK